MKNQIIFITGASSGMGKVTAIQLAKEGHTVYGAARRVEKMTELVEAGGHAIAMDITKADQVKAAVDQIIAEQGRIDVLVNNAGFGLYGAVEETSIDEARYQFEVNIFGLAQVTQLVLPHMRQQKAGKIINISSMGGKMYTPLGAWYHGTKHALEGWSDSLRLELKQFGIDVVIIEPGVIETEFGNVMADPMLERSGSGPYADLTKAVYKAYTDNYKPGAGSPATVISNTISKAIKSRRPKTRYVVGKMAKPMIWMRKYLGDRIFDAALMMQAK
jgi:short-subunit dehydrogenase